MILLHRWFRHTADYAFWLVLLTCVPAAQAQREISGYPQYVFPTCLEEIPLIKVPPIFGGCQLPDCCPRCAASHLIDWHIWVDGPVEGVSFEFNRLAARRAMEVEGPARWGAGTTLIVGPGDSRVRGLPSTTPENPLSARPQARFDTMAIARRLAQARGSGGALPQVDARIVVEQMVRGVVVNERVIVYRFRRCQQMTAITDRIRLDNNAGADNAVVFLSARRASGCVLHEILRGIGTFSVGSVLSNQNCRSEVSVFSDDDAVQFIENVTSWTDALGDLLTIDLTPDRWQVPVDVWITQDALQTRSHDEIGKADGLLNSNHAGIDVLTKATYQPVLSAGNATAINSFAENAWNFGMCQNLASITGNAAIFTQKHINVYFVDQPFTGLRCPTTNVILIGTKAETETLAHEFGHAFSLSHVNEKDYNGDGTIDFPSTNIMMAEVSGRTTFTEGQCFRMTLNPTSMLNVNGVRTAGQVKTCPDDALPPTSPGCPWSALDAFPN